MAALEPEALRRRLAHVRWIGGGSGAGKSTIAGRLAAALGLQLYSTDAAMAGHAARCGPVRCPSLTAFRNMTMDERWLNRSPLEMLESFHWFRGEAFDLIVEDLLALPADRGVVVEGFRLLPRLVKPLLASPADAVWLIPTPAFRRAAFESRGSLMEIPGRTSDPQRALQTLLERDALFTARLAEEVAAQGLAAIPVDVGLTQPGLLQSVAARLGL
ncbi:MAG TPA: hypothetical protein VG248_00215 [Caulobacteraceae bacterium]|nr:hypothetical protein [Caulobacteraceae bacterium]